MRAVVSSSSPAKHRLSSENASTVVRVYDISYVDCIHTQVTLMFL